MSIINTALIGKLKKEKADLASPDLTGTPTAPTAATTTNTTQIATTAFVQQELGALTTGVEYYSQTTVPVSPGDGAFWFDQETGKTFQYHVDNDGTKFWLEVGSGDTADILPTLSETVIEVTNDATLTYNFNYHVDFVQVFINRLKLKASEFTATNGTSITLVGPIEVGDEIEFVTVA